MITVVIFPSYVDFATTGAGGGGGAVAVAFLDGPQFDKTNTVPTKPDSSKIFFMRLINLAMKISKKLQTNYHSSILVKWFCRHSGNFAPSDATCNSKNISKCLFWIIPGNMVTLPCNVDQQDGDNGRSLHDALSDQSANGV